MSNLRVDAVVKPVKIRLMFLHQSFGEMFFYVIHLLPWHYPLRLPKAFIDKLTMGAELVTNKEETVNQTFK